MESAQPRVGLIGLGALGGELAHRLLGAGHALTVWGRRAEKLQPWLAAGAHLATDAAELAAACDVVLLCVTDTAAVGEVVFGSRGIAAGARPGTLLVDHSTIHPVDTRDYAARLAAQTGMGWVDAPVTGGVPAARAGRLVVMVGGEPAHIARVEPLLAAYSQRVTRMGGVGAGQATKVANQMMIGAHVAVAAEALNYVARFGVEAAALPDALAGGWADSAVLQHHARRMAAADYTTDVDARIMAKDLDIALDLGRLTESPLPVTALVVQLYRQLIAQGDHDKGQIGLMWLYRQGPT